MYFIISLLSPPLKAYWCPEPWLSPWLREEGKKNPQFLWDKGHVALSYSSITLSNAACQGEKKKLHFVCLWLEGRGGEKETGFPVEVNLGWPCEIGIFFCLASTLFPKPFSEYISSKAGHPRTAVIKVWNGIPIWELLEWKTPRPYLIPTERDTQGRGLEIWILTRLLMHTTVWEPPSQIREW